ncbi:MAG: hypothetical protein NBV63_03010 [Candidatus Pacebacteria bacterium]|nr:hypothetical protein [Candidatus Paceibacterota bacterium]
MKTLTTSIIVALIVLSPFSALAAQFEHGDIVTLTEERALVDNIYVAGGQVTVSALAQKDLYVAGGKVLQNGDVWGDIGAAGGTVDVFKSVRGDVRVVGGQVTIQGTVGGDVIIAGGAVTILKGTTITGDIIVAGGAVTMDGSVDGQAKIYAGEVRMNGTVQGPVTIFSHDLVTFGGETVLGSTLTYHAPTEATVADGAQLGVVTFVPLNVPKVDAQSAAALMLGIMSVLFVAKLIALAVASILVAEYYPRITRAVVTASLAEFGTKLVIGVALLIAVPVIAFMLLLSVIGSYVGGIVLVLYGLVFLVAGVFSAVLTGALVQKALKREVHSGWKWSLIGAVLISAIGLVPFVGWVVVCVIFATAFGTIVSLGHKHLTHHA